jgi:hypothetical protein
MAAANLTVSSIPYSLNNIAVIELIVSVTDDTGAPITGLKVGSFVVHWLLNATEQALEPISVQGVGALDGVYDIHVQSKGTTWTPAQGGVTIFVIAVVEPIVLPNHKIILKVLGQTLYTPPDELIPPNK